MSDKNIEYNKRNWPVYRVYGHNFTSDFSFSSNLLKTKNNPDLTFTCTTKAPFKNKKGLEILFFTHHPLQ
jgi:hypothetical protein